MINRKSARDPNALKIASFRTKEGVWADFSAKAESIGLTATDVLKTAMGGFLNGSYNPLKIEPMSTVIDNAQYGTEISTLKSEVEDLKKLLAECGTNKSPDVVLGLEAVNKCIDTAIDHRVLQLIKPLADRLAELETCTRT